MHQHICRTCGSGLTQQDEFSWRCPYCGNVYTNEKAKQEAQTLKKTLDDQKIELINNLRRNLYDAVTEEFMSKERIAKACEAIKALLPDDFAAGFFYTAVKGTKKDVAKALRNFNLSKNPEYAELIIRFSIKTVTSETSLALMNLIERVYKNSDLEKFEKYATALSFEMGRVDDGTYSTILPRDVFVAYSSKDMAKVEELVEVLEENKISCFVAARNLRHGSDAVENYQHALEEAMDNCKTIVFVSSLNSRSTDCDAIKYELSYVKKKDLENAPAEYKQDYTTLPEKYKKPRVEYRIENSKKFNAADAVVSEFFKGFEYTLSPEATAKRIVEEKTKIKGPETPQKVLSPQTTRNNTKKIVAAILAFAIIVGAAIALPKCNWSTGTNGKDVETTLSAEGKKQTLDAAKAYADLSDFASAIKITKEALDKNPTDIDFLSAYASYYSAYEEYITKEAEKLAFNDNYEAAITLLDAGLETISDSKKLAEAKRTYTAALAAKEKQKVLDSAKAFADAKNYPSAIALISEALKTATDDVDFIVAYGKYCSEYEDTVLTEAEAQANEKNYTTAISILDSALKTIPDSTKLANKKTEYEVAKAEAEKQKVLNDAKAYADKKDYLSAINLIKEAQKSNASDTDYKNAYNEYLDTYIEAVIKEADTLNLAGRPLDALKIVNEALSNIGDHSSLTAKAKIYEDTYVSGIETEVNTFLSVEKISEAKALLQSASSNLPNNQAIKDLINKVNAYKIVSLNTLTPTKGEIEWESGLAGGPSGIVYKDVDNFAILHSSWSDIMGACENSITRSTEYSINKEFTSIEFNIAPHSHFRSSSFYYSYIKVYADGVLIYTSPKITQKTAMFSTGKIDITNVTTLKIVGEMQGHSCTMISSVYLKNTP